MNHIQPVVSDSVRPKYREPVAPKLRKLEVVAFVLIAAFFLAAVVYLTGTAISFEPWN